MRDKILDIDLTYTGNVVSHEKSDQDSKKVRGKILGSKQVESINTQAIQEVPHHDLIANTTEYITPNEVPVKKSEMEAEL